MIIYRIDNCVTGDFYIGMTSQRAKYRLQRHFRNARDGYQTHLCRAIRRYGHEQFSVTVVENCSSREVMSLREQFWIAQLSPRYNMTAGGDGGDTSSSPAFVKAMCERDYRGEKNPMFGKRNILSPHFGKSHSEKTKGLMQKSAKASWENADERRAKARARMLENPASSANAKRIVFEGVEYFSVADASRSSGRSHWYIKKHGFFK